MVGRSPWRFLIELTRFHRKSLAGFGLALTFATATSFVGPVLLGRFIDQAATLIRASGTGASGSGVSGSGSGGATSGSLFLPAFGYLAAGLVSSVVQVMVSWRATTLAWEITNDLRSELASGVFDADRGLMRDTTPGELVSRIDGDVTALTAFLSKFVSGVLSVIALAVGGVLVLAVWVPWLAPVFALHAVLLSWFLWRRRNAALIEAVAEREAEADVLSVVEERLSGAIDIATLGAGSNSVARLAQATDGQVSASSRRARAQMRLVGEAKTLLALGQAMMLLSGGFLYVHTRISLGAVVLGFRLVSTLRNPIERMIWQLQDLQGAGGSAQRISELLDRLNLSKPTASGSLPAGPLSVSLSGVRLAYDDGDVDVLSDITLHVAAGHRLGIVGRTGSGKTSIARLVLRLVNASGGSIRMGDVPVEEVAEADFRQRVSAIPQEVQVFPGSVRDNITLFDDSISTEDVLAALDDVGLTDWLANQPDGLDARILSSDGNVGFSAGEAQLMSLARLFLRGPDVIVLDEATSRIDPATQLTLSQATERLLVGRTAIVIAHRLATLDTCTDIAVIDGGRVVEFGRRDDLLADPASRFSALVALGAEDVLA
jgi:ATP-binding cassette, subfamily B, bacterial